ncbi:hypothetical protein KP509_34G068400 [Ceratopteris richardii]|uniref:Uncharacterized protein n=1 Tax=Ceratopteris richardii TaxID=49495 RepID=A0A8T2QN52_CERRI|nr:hypothetical protein KP509_34G068400 [Ceratopteris richardii]
MRSSLCCKSTEKHALLHTKEDPLAMQSEASTDLLFAKQRDEEGDAFAPVPDSSPCALPCFISGLAHISPPSTKPKNINVRFTQIAIFDSVRQIRASLKCQ